MCDMNSGFLLASEKSRRASKHSETRDLLAWFEGQCESPTDEAHLRLARLLLTGEDRRDLPEEEKADSLFY